MQHYSTQPVVVDPVKVVKIQLITTVGGARYAVRGLLLTL